MPRFLSTADLARRWGVTDRTIRNWIYRGSLKAVRPNPTSPWRIPADSAAVLAIEEPADTLRRATALLASIMAEKREREGQGDEGE